MSTLGREIFNHPVHPNGNKEIIRTITDKLHPVDPNIPHTNQTQIVNITNLEMDSPSLPRNYASTNLNFHSTYPNSCFDFSDLKAFATLHPVDSFDLDGYAGECPSTTPCSEVEDETDGLELTYSGSSSGSAGSRSTSLSTPASKMVVKGTLRTAEQDDVIDRVIAKLQGYSLAQAHHHDTDSLTIGKMRNNRDRNGKSGMSPAVVVVSEEDSLLWTKVWGSAKAVRNAKERRRIRRVTSKGRMMAGL